MCNPEPEWYRALTLSERVTEPLRIEVQQQSGPAALRRLQEWVSQAPFNSGDWFSQRLSLLGIEQKRFIDLLGESDLNLKERLPDAPDWLAYTLKAFASYEAHASFPAPISSGTTQEFLHLVAPLIWQGYQDACRLIHERCCSQESLPFDKDVALSLFCPPLYQQLTAIIARTAALELKVASLQGLLQGESPEKRFQSFIERLRHPEISLGILREYPVMARLVAVCVQMWSDSTSEFLARLSADWKLIRLKFSPSQDPGQLEGVTGGLSDRHRKGRTVLVARFTSGLRVVYKPKSLAVDAHFASLLQWLHGHGSPLLKVPAVLPRGFYGWTEYIESFPCSTEEELRRFYERQGCLLALLYALNATDMHYENLIAAGENPVLIDLESLFHPCLARENGDNAGTLANSAVVGSVLHVGLLPQRHSGRNGKESIEISGLGGEPGQRSFRPVPSWENIGTDEMVLTRKHAKMAAGSNRPSLEGKIVSPLEYEECILKGFASMYGLLVSCRADLMTEGGPLDCFLDDPTRSILRHTRFYAMLLNESIHPDLLRNALDRDRVIDRLWFGLGPSPDLQRILRLIPFESQDLWQGDIPFFHSKVGSRHLWTSSDKCIPDFFEQSGMAAVHARLNQLCSKDLAQQIWIIKASLTTLAIAAEPKWTRYVKIQRSRTATKEQYLEMACAVGDRLEELAICGEAPDASWIGLSLSGDGHWSLAPLGLDLYAGLPGVCLFLAYLGRISARPKYTCLAKKAARSIRRQTELAGKLVKSVGAFQGWGGLLYTWMHLGFLWQEDWLSDAEFVLAQMRALGGLDNNFDILSGSAGGIATCLSFFAATGSVEALEAAKRMGEQLVATAQDLKEGCGWTVPINPDHPLTGFSHGASGIAWALLELYAVTHDELFKATALKALAFEDNIFSIEEKNWPDLRSSSQSDGNTRFMVAWCHGAPGIGLSRLAIMRRFFFEGLERDLEYAISTTKSHGFGNNHSLCHGDFGNLELINVAASQLKSVQLAELGGQLGSEILSSIEEHGWLCGVPLSVETPGLLPGLAGIGYGLLRLVEPSSVPSVLLLDPPACT